MGLQGTWHNELGSVLRIGPVTDGAFDLVYETAVSAKNCAKGEFVGSGRLDDAPIGRTVGFVVAWQNERSDCASVTAWSGALQTVGGDEQLVAMWLLTGIQSKNDWASTNVGRDVFSRTQAPEDVVAQNLSSKRHSHP